MIGREYESARLQKMLLDPEVRLVTVLGPPGVGKTCLSLNVTRKILSAFKHGVVFVDLSPIQDPRMLLPSLALAMGVREKADALTQEAIQSALAGKNCLLLLDNFEQIADAAPQLLPLLGAAPEIKILATSRESLRLRGEHELHLAPLPVPAENEKNSIEQLQNLPSINLFVERAQAVKPEFKLDEKSASHVAEICSRLDGLPLALELAAARIGALSLTGMLEQFDRRFDWLTQGARDLPEWRQTLQGAIEWSYNLLSESERVLFYRLSIFTGGWTLDSAEDVCSDDDICGRAEILNLLIQLANKSLIVADAESGRFRFLETLREFAHEKLETSGKLQILGQRHFDYFLKLLNEAKPHLQQGGDQAFWLNRVEREHNNLRAALAWAVEEPSRANLALEFGFAVHVFWMTRSYIDEARYWLGKILSLDASPTPIRADLLRYSSDYASSQGDYENSRRFEEEAMDISRALGDEAGIYYSKDGLAMQAGMLGDYARAAELLEEVLAYRQKAGNMSLLTTTLNNLAIATRRLGNFERAKHLYEEVIRITRETGNSKSLAHGLHGLAEVRAQMGEYETSIQLHRESISIRRQLGELKGMAFSLNSLAMCFEKLGKFHLAAQLESFASRIRDELGLVISPATREENADFLKRLRMNLDDAAFEAAWADGQTMSEDQVLSLVMGSDDAGV